jgi:hypothetical protein
MTPFRRRIRRVKRTPRMARAAFLERPMTRARFARTLGAAIGLVLIGIAPAWAQFGTIFGDPPPRPPADVPRGSIDDDRYPGRLQERRSPDRLPPPQALPEVRPLIRPPSNVQSQPLPPPPGAPAVPLDTRPEQPAQAAQPPAQRPRGTPQPANTAPQPGDEVVSEPPSQKVANKTALFSGLDKITGRIIKFDVALEETVQFGALQVTPHACYTRPPTESPNTVAFIDVDEVTLQGEVRSIFKGWVFASSPGLHAVEHSIYDVWLTDCKDPVNPPQVAEQQSSPPVPPQRPARPPAQPQRQTAQPQRQPAPRAPAGTIVTPR